MTGGGIGIDAIGSFAIGVQDTPTATPFGLMPGPNGAGDLAIAWDPVNAWGDWALNLAGNDLMLAPSLETMAWYSIMTDARAPADAILPNDTDDPRGCWTDTGARYPSGSLIWLRQRSKATPQTLAQVRQDIIDATQWMILDGWVASIDVYTEWTRPRMLGARTIFNRTAKPPVRINYGWAWSQLALV